MMLQAILADTRRRVEESRQAHPRAALERLAQQVATPLDLVERLRRPGVQLIAEVKRRSPSRGDLRLDLAPATLAAAYADGGAAAISVLTEPEYFGGTLEDLLAVRDGLRHAGHALPVLRKDFIVDVYQLAEARAYGADAVLLIVAALSADELSSLYAEAHRWGMSALIEVHDEGELERALALGPRLLGVNCRNLRDMTVDLRVIERLRPLVPQGTVVVAESGIRGPEDVRALRELDVDAVLVGETLVRATCPLAAARELVEAGV